MTERSAAIPRQKGLAAVNGIELYYEIYGEGKPLVLLHGGGSTIDTSFGRVIPELARNRCVVGVELQAHGRSGDRDAPLSFEQDADDVAALLKTLQISRADIWGFSNGGTTALQMAIRHPEQTGKIVVASALAKRSGTPAAFWDFMKQATLEHMPRVYQETYLRVAPHPEKLQVMHDKCAQRMVHFRDIPDSDLQSIQSPTLIVMADQDVATPEHAVEMHRLIPGSRLAIFPGGHGDYMGEITTLQPGKAPALVILPVLEAFLQ